LLAGELVWPVGLLQRDPQPLAERALIPCPPHSEHLDVARGGLQQAFEDLDGRRLPRAVRSQEAEALAATHRQVEPVHGSHPIVFLDQPAAADGEVHHRFFGRAISTVSGRSRSGLPLAATYAPSLPGWTSTYAYRGFKSTASTVSRDCAAASASAPASASFSQPCSDPCETYSLIRSAGGGGSAGASARSLGDSA